MQSFKYKGTPEQLAKVAEYCGQQGFKNVDSDGPLFGIFVFQQEAWEAHGGYLFVREEQYEDENFPEMPLELELAIFGKTGGVTGKVEQPWVENKGYAPVGVDGRIDAKFASGYYAKDELTTSFSWGLHGNAADITHWRLHTPDEEYFKQPETMKGSTTLSTTTNSTWSDKYYDNNYTLTEADKAAGVIRVDAYFVAQQWKLGQKDDTGVLFHCLKTITRFGNKNDKQREIIALHKQIKRLAELEGVVLK